MVKRITINDKGRAKNIDWKGLVVDTLYLRDRGLCGLCLREITDRDLFEVDHVVERKDGGMDVLKNLRIVHLACHKARHTTISATTISPDVIKTASIMRGIIKIGEADSCLTIKSEVDLAADRKLLELIKNAYLETHSITKTAQICGMNYDQLNYFKRKHHLTGKPNQWLF